MSTLRTLIAVLVLVLLSTKETGSIDWLYVGPEPELLNLWEIELLDRIYEREEARVN